MDGGCLHYIDEGRGPVVVMVHGNPTWSFYYRHLIHSLKQKYRVICLDHLGCGMSDKPSDYKYDLKNHVSNLNSLLDFLAIDRCSLIVHDWGGAIGFGVATKRLDNIDKIVVLNSAAFRSKRIPLRIQICRIPFIGEILVRGLNGFAFFAQFMTVVKSMSPSVKKAYIAPYDSWKNRIAIYRFVRDIPLKPSHQSYPLLVDIENGLEEVKKKKIPLLLLWGGKDFCFNKDFFERWRQFFPEAKYHYFNDGGHYILEDKHKEIIPLVREFLG